MRRIGILAFVAGALLLPSCQQKEEKKTPDAPKATTAASTVATAPAAAKPGAGEEDVDIPTEEDYEAEAARTVTAENLETELDKLEKEIEGG